MESKVIFITFSDDKIINRRETDMYGYYDGDNPEIDDGNFIKANKITVTEIHIYDNGKYILHKNYFGADGMPYRFETTENGVTSVEETQNRTGA